MIACMRFMCKWPAVADGGQGGDGSSGGDIDRGAGWGRPRAGSATDCVRCLAEICSFCRQLGAKAWLGSLRLQRILDEKARDAHVYSWSGGEGIDVFGVAVLAFRPPHIHAASAAVTDLSVKARIENGGAC
jgi:hypothetical protein